MLHSSKCYRKKPACALTKCWTQFFYCFFLAILLDQRCHAATYYVSADEGNDQNSGLNWQNSLKSLNKAADKAVAGDTVVIRKSSTPYRNLNIVRSGQPDRPIRFMGENRNDPPVISGAVRVTPKEFVQNNSYLVIMEKIEPMIVALRDTALSRASNDQIRDGDWFWRDGTLRIRSEAINSSADEIWILRNGGGISLGKNGWIELSDLKCWMGRGACISIKGGSHNHVERIHSKWQWRGIDITNGGHNNIIDNCFFEENREGAYIRNASSFNTIQNCRLLRNGRDPLWRSGDRHAIGIGENGPNRGNVVMNNIVDNNGGPPDNVAVIAFRAPETIFSGNIIRDNYGSGLFITIDSEYSAVIDNVIQRNGIDAVRAGISGITPLSIRNAHNVRVVGNKITNNSISSGDERTRTYKTPHGAIDISGHKGSNMRNVFVDNNLIEANVGGRAIYVSPYPDVQGLHIEPDP